MKITVVGTGYVGLVSGACLAEVGNDVLCVDVDAKKIRILNEGGIPIYEPGLEAMVARNRRRRTPAFHHRRGEAASPRQHSVHRRRHAARRGRLGRPAVRGRRPRATSASTWTATGWWSTSPRCRSAPPTRCARRLPRNSRHAAPTYAFSVVSNPEFLKEGAAVEDFMRPDRIVIGADDERAIAADARALRAVPAQSRAPAS